MILSLVEEAEAIDWYEQRMSLEQDADARAIMHAAQKEEFKHFGMDLEFLLRKKPEWRATLQGILFSSGDIVEKGKQAEKAADKTPAGSFAAGEANGAHAAAPESKGTGKRPR